MTPPTRVRAALLYLLLAGSVSALAQDKPSAAIPVISPPNTFFELVRERDREAARAFYKKYVDVQGIPVVASEEVADGAWKGAAAMHDPHRYWLAAVLAYFHAGGEQPAPSGSQTPIDTREKLQASDPQLYDLVHEVFAYGGRIDWRLRP